MTTFDDFALLIHALAHIVHALAIFLAMPRRRRKKRR
jgi:hypothetical protein